MCYVVISFGWKLIKSKEANLWKEREIYFVTVFYHVCGMLLNFETVEVFSSLDNKCCDRAVDNCKCAST